MPKDNVIQTSVPNAFDGRKEETAPPIKYTEEELDYRGYLIERLERAKYAREQPHIEFDDKPYLDQHTTNAKAANSYNPPRANEEDTRIVTGTTQEKENTLLSSLLNFNFEGSIDAHDKNDMIIGELGNDMEDMVRKSRRMEKYDAKRPLLYKEVLDQGTAFIEEIKTEQIVYDKTLRDIESGMGGVNIENIKWDTKLRKLYAKCEVSLLSGTNVYLGNIREFFLNKQPYAFIRYEVPYDIAKADYADWDRWKNVPKTINRQKSTQDQVEYRNWSLLDSDKDSVEVIKYQDPINNEFMIMLNGVMMLPIKFPLTAISPSGRFTFVKGDAEPISKFFAYSKSIPAKTKVDQAVLDEMLKMILLKMKQSAIGTWANNTGQVLSRKALLAGKMLNGVNPEQLKRIGNFEGPNQSEFNAFKLMKELLNEKSVDPVFSGQDAGSGQTATEIIQRKQQQMLRLGQTVVGIVNMETELIELRIHNILANWSIPVDQRVDKVRNELVNVYRSFSMEATMQDNGRKGERIISFDPTAADHYSTDEGKQQLQRVEDKIKEKTGKDVRFTFMNPERIREFEVTWYVDVAPTEKITSELESALFKTTIADSIALFGPQAVNMENAKLEFAQKNKLDPDKFFMKSNPQPQQEIPGGQPGAPQGPQPVDQLTSQVTKGAQPSLNNLLNAA